MNKEGICLKKSNNTNYVFKKMVMKLPLYPDYVIQEVIDKSDIVEVISEHVALKRSGSNYMGLCPFHNEKTPSFSVSPQKGIFHCFGCGEGGTVITFLMKIENLTFLEALKVLAQKANIMLPEANLSDGKKEAALKDKKETLFNINHEAAQFFYKKLSQKDGEVAVAYFKERQLTGQCAKYFCLGYSPNKRNELLEYLLQKGYNEEDIFKAGLTSKRDDGTYYDRFRNRIMFPIFNINDKVIGFGARRITEDVNPKYLNTSDTLIYNKSKNLYSLNIARRSKMSEIILVEGYMDVITVVKYGIQNVTATLGTALTSDQAKLLKRYFNEVIICYDSDDAGLEAKKRAISILRDLDIKTSVMTVEGAKDTDEFLKKYGKDRFLSLISRRKSDILYLMDIFGAKYELQKNIEDRIKYIGELIPYLSKVKNDVELDVYIEEISKRAKTSSQAIYAQLGKTRLIKNGSPQGAQPPSIAPYAGAILTDKLEKTRELLLAVLADNVSIFLKFEDILSQDLFENEIHIKLFNMIKEKSKSHHKLEAASVMVDFDENEVGEVTKILSIDAKCDNKSLAVKDYINSIMQEQKNKKINELLANGDMEALNELLKNK